MPDFIINLSGTRPIIDENANMSQEFRAWVQTISNRSLIIGVGSPEGMIEAVVGSAYMDSTASTGSVQYVKQKADIGGDKKQGWIL